MFNTLQKHRQDSRRWVHSYSARVLLKLVHCSAHCPTLSPWSFRFHISVRSQAWDRQIACSTEIEILFAGIHIFQSDLAITRSISINPSPQNTTQISSLTQLCIGFNCWQVNTLNNPYLNSFTSNYNSPVNG